MAGNLPFPHRPDNLGSFSIRLILGISSLILNEQTIWRGGHSCVAGDYRSREMSPRYLYVVN